MENVSKKTKQKNLDKNNGRIQSAAGVWMAGEKYQSKHLCVIE